MFGGYTWKDFSEGHEAPSPQPLPQAPTDGSHVSGEDCWSYKEINGKYVCETCGADMDDDFDPSGPDENDPCWDYH